MKITKAELKYIRSLQQKKVRDEERKFLLEGWRAMEECLSSNTKPDLVAIQVDRVSDEHSRTLQRLHEQNVPVREVTPKELHLMTETVNAQGIVGVVRQKELRWAESMADTVDLIVALDSVADPGNLGTILRTCDWFGVSLVLLSRGCVSLYNEKVVRSTVGSLFRINVVEDVDLADVIPSVKKKGFMVLATGSTGSVLPKSTAHGRTLLIFGSEAHGINEKFLRLADSAVSIPKRGGGESLNVAVAVGIMLSQLRLPSFV